jgi:hypothetical protein
MQLENLIKRLKTAYKTKSLRELREICGVSHEQIRKIIKSKSELNLTTQTCDKIEQGLLKNGF